MVFVMVVVRLVDAATVMMMTIMLLMMIMTMAMTMMTTTMMMTRSQYLYNMFDRDTRTLSPVLRKPGA